MKKLIALFMLMCSSVMAAGTSGWHYVQYDGTNLATVQGAGTTILFKASEVQTNASSGSGFTNTWGLKAFTNLGLNVQSIPGSGIVVTNQGSTNSIGVDYGFADVTNPIVGSTGWTPADTNYSRDATHLTNAAGQCRFFATSIVTNPVNMVDGTFYTQYFSNEVYDIGGTNYDVTTATATPCITGLWYFAAQVQASSDLSDGAGFGLFIYHSTSNGVCTNVYWKIETQSGSQAIITPSINQNLWIEGLSDRVWIKVRANDNGNDVDVTGISGGVASWSASANPRVFFKGYYIGR